ncbi:MAG: glucosaminidase domain-containing protein [Flavobacteriales bacterium]|nr:glucosaminidase domain-containing protein [Flavobacteriales bacterium]
MNRFLLFFGILLRFFNLHAQKNTAEDYIRMYKDAAIENMKLKKVPASITLAQGLLESGNGNSELAIKANNHFGIKCHAEWKGETYYKDDDKPNECFRKYKSVLDSYKDHADFLTSRDRYKGLFELEITDYKGWARGLKAAGYATNPNYAEQLINLIERYKLHEYDQPQQIVEKNKPYNSTQLPNDIKSNQSGTGIIFFINGLRAIKVAKDQTKQGIATDFGLKVKHLEKYNELGTSDELYEGQLIFLEPKRNAAEPEKNIHIVKEGETFYSIAHMYGMTVKALLQKNRKGLGSILTPGEKLYLRKMKPKTSTGN